MLVVYHQNGTASSRTKGKARVTRSLRFVEGFRSSVISLGVLTVFAFGVEAVDCREEGMMLWPSERRKTDDEQLRMTVASLGDDRQQQI